MYLALESLLTSGSETLAAERLDAMICEAEDTFPKAISFARLLVRTVGHSAVLAWARQPVCLKQADRQGFFIHEL